jgi:hypothetical protein
VTHAAYCQRHRRAGFVALFHHSMIRVIVGASGFFNFTQSAQRPDIRPITVA